MLVAIQQNTWLCELSQIHMWALSATASLNFRHKNQ